MAKNRSMAILATIIAAMMFLGPVDAMGGPELHHGVWAALIGVFLCLSLKRVFALAERPSSY